MNNHDEKTENGGDPLRAQIVMKLLSDRHPETLYHPASINPFDLSEAEVFHTAAHTNFRSQTVVYSDGKQLMGITQKGRSIPKAAAFFKSPKGVINRGDIPGGAVKQSLTAEVYFMHSLREFYSDSVVLAIPHVIGDYRYDYIRNNDGRCVHWSAYLDTRYGTIDVTEKGKTKSIPVGKYLHEIKGLQLGALIVEHQGFDFRISDIVTSIYPRGSRDRIRRDRFGSPFMSGGYEERGFRLGTADLYFNEINRQSPSMPCTSPQFVVNTFDHILFANGLERLPESIINGEENLILQRIESYLDENDLDLKIIDKYATHLARMLAQVHVAGFVGNLDTHRMGSPFSPRNHTFTTFRDWDTLSLLPTNFDSYHEYKPFMADFEDALMSLGFVAHLFQPDKMANLDLVEGFIKKYIGEVQYLSSMLTDFDEGYKSRIKKLLDTELFYGERGLRPEFLDYQSSYFGFIGKKRQRTLSLVLLPEL